MKESGKDGRIQTGIPDLRDPQAGAGILGIIAFLGIVFALVQGTLHYRAKTSAKFLGKEKNKVLAQQAAEAGVEENIADLGSRATVVTNGMENYPTYTAKAVGTGNFTTKLTTLATGPEADTVLLSSLGRVSSVSQTVSAKLRVKRYMDTVLTPTMAESTEVVIRDSSRTWIDTTYTNETQDPETMPALNTTPAYTACMASSAKKCDVCHIPGGNPTNRHVINVSKSAIGTHIGHHGDYVTTDGTCDIYLPHLTPHYTSHTMTIRDTTYIDHTVYDTVVVIDTLAKVQILSWK